MSSSASKPSAYASSRVIIKNLPKYFTEDKVKAHFSSKGSISDVKLCKTAEGKSRRFAFVGFHSAAEAKAAIAYFNNTFVDTCKISVETAKSHNDPTLPRPWSKYSQGSSAHSQRQSETSSSSILLETDELKKGNLGDAEKRKSLLKAEIEQKKKTLMKIYSDKDDAELRAYLDAMRPQSKVKSWENQDSFCKDASLPVEKSSSLKKSIPKVVKVEAVVDKRSTAKGEQVARAHVVFEGEDDSDDEYEDFPLEEKSQTNEDEEKEDEEKKEDENSNDQETGEQKNTDSLDQKKDSQLENGRLFIRNLAYDCTEEDLKDLFSPFGEISSIHIPISRETKRSKGFAFVLFMFPEHAINAFTQLDGSIFQGRLLHILPAKDALQSASSGEDLENSPSYKASKEAKAKKEATKEYNWNTLFLNSNAIADAIAKELNLAKSEILNPEAESLATRIALAETKIIHSTKAYLEQEGVVLDAFSSSYCSNGKRERSTTVLLVKNIPFETCISEIESLFGRYGSLTRTILPPTKGMAIVEYSTPQEARNAFSNLAYSKFKNLPLYLEWAPIGSLRAKVSSELLKEEALKTSKEQENDELLPQDSPISHVSLFVKNLNFSTSESELFNLFSPIGGVLSAKIATKPDAKRKGERLSMGFGFVEFKDLDSAKRALDTMQNVLLDGHALQLKFSKNANSTGESSSKATKTLDDASNALPSTKIIVRNIPFEASEKECKTLFKSFAQVKKVRLPRKFDGGHRGFGFVEFLTKADAKNAFEMLSHTHLYGRHLVLEWAKDEMSIDELREKTKRQMQAQSSSSSKKIALSELEKEDSQSADEEDSLEYYQ